MATESPQHHITFTPAGRSGSTLSAIRELWDFRGYIFYLTRRDLRTKYNRSLLGWIWSILNPLVTLAIYSLVFGVILLVDRNIGVSPTGLQSFPHFLFSGLIVWQLFNQTSMNVMSGFTSAIVLRRKLYFPPAAPAISKALVNLVDSSIELLVLAAFYIIAGNFGITFVFVPVLMIVAVIFGLGVGLLLAVANVRYRDVGYIYTLFMRLFFYITPIIWPFQMIEDRIGNRWVKLAAEFNPLAKLIDVCRTVTYSLAWPNLFDLAYLAGVGTVLTVVGWTVFNRSAADAAEGM